MSELLYFTLSKCLQRKTATIRYTLGDHAFSCKLTELHLEGCNIIADRIKVYEYQVAEGSITEAMLSSMTTLEIAYFLRKLRTGEEYPADDAETELEHSQALAAEPIEPLDPWGSCNDNNYPD